MLESPNNKDQVGVTALREALDQVAEALPVRSRREAEPLEKLTEPRSDLPILRLRWTPAVAACLTALALAYPVFLGVVEAPRLQRELASERMKLSSGPVDLNIVSMSRTNTRGERQDTERLQAGHDSQILIVEIDPRWIEITESGTVFLLSLHHEDDEYHGDNEYNGDNELRSWTFDHDRLRSWLRTVEGIPLMLPVHELRAGIYELRLQNDEHAQETLISTARFEVVQE